MGAYWVYILTNKPRATLYVRVTGAAIQREKNIKHWPRLWKLELVKSSNPQWRDLYSDITR